MKTLSGATYGVQFIQADIENPAEMVEPDLNKQMMWAREKLNMRWGIHAELNQFMAWESGLEEFWRQSHRKLHKYLDLAYDIFIKKQKDGQSYEKYRPEYMNFHASYMQPLEFITERYRMMVYTGVDFKGRRDFRQLFNEVPELKKWFTENLLQILVPPQNDIHIIDSLKKNGVANPTPEQINEEKYKMWEHGLGYRENPGGIDSEEFIYTLIAKYLEIKKNDPSEPLWNSFFGNEKFENIVKIDLNKRQIILTPPVVAAAASRFVIGHFQSGPLEFEIDERQRQSKEPIDEFYKLNALQKLEKIKTFVCFEPPELMEGFEGMNRILHIKHIYSMTKAMNSQYIKILVDFEHLLHNGLNPDNEILELPDDLNKYMIGCHLGTPKPIHPAHEPIQVGSEGHRLLYKWIFMLRKKGFKDGYLIFERGGRPGSPPGEFIGQSVTAIKLIVEHLEKDILPEKLPLKFFGVATGEASSPERQWVIIREHAYEPIKGLIVAPEEEYTFLGGAATAKPGVNPEKWKKEELR